MKIQKKQKGAAAIEFAIIFPIFFLIFYAVVTYGLIFAAQQTITLAASEGARAAVRYQNGKDATERQALRIAEACNMSNQVLNWLRKAGSGQSTGAGVCSTGITTTQVTADKALCPTLNGVTCIKVLVTYDYDKAPLVPKLLGPLMGLPTPKTLQGQAVAQISLMD
ncbi:MAG: TadE/TadG family type IV pilus assembly protein [Comamonas sp.]|uniref:TadE/TadG family type IV pilus assembly protein n=1 Tax=Comamonas sp. TaxID=34028 RepID=UPI002FC61B70